MIDRPQHYLEKFYIHVNVCADNVVLHEVKLLFYQFHAILQMHVYLASSIITIKNM